ncbi:hypothetical protein, partial [Nocardioides sp. cx-173]|uniref:hypothetical protein n=1 Tax=Nocardioides sp. cx-173 TaxID=2898796 RepID=UPI0035B397C6
MAVALSDAAIGALIRCGTDPFGGFELNQLLKRDPDRVADQIGAITGTERLEEFGQGRLWQGHRWLSFNVSLGRYTPKIPPMAVYVFTPRRQPSNPTTPRDSP